MSPQRSPG